MVSCNSSLITQSIIHAIHEMLLAGYPIGTLFMKIFTATLDVPLETYSVLGEEFSKGDEILMSWSIVPKIKKLEESILSTAFSLPLLNLVSDYAFGMRFQYGKYIEAAQ